MESLEEKLAKLPPDLKQEAHDFIDFLLNKIQKKKGKLSLNWAGCLKQYKDQFTSVQLQKKALEWR